MIARPEKLIAPFFSDLVWRMPAMPRGVYFTFDDGPTPGVTEQVLDKLDAVGGKATFFALGKQVASAPQLFEKIIADGHSVGNHTMTHPKGWKTNSEKYIRDIEEAAQWITSPLFRPPYGKITPAQIRMLKPKYKIVMWDVLSRDYDPRLNLPKAAKYLETHIQSGSIVVFHDSLKAHKNMIPLLSAAINHCRKQSLPLLPLPMDHGPTE
jgi:peptidoglycan/xylan/chitin deacetylase (PgdA/CDA1 family)